MFDWMRSGVPSREISSWPDRALESTRREIQERAALLLRLGRSVEEAEARCRQNLEWDFAPHAPALLDEVPSLVREVYRRTLTLDPVQGT